ncbi:exportin-7 protein, putative (macronuclear) [Tetrahymena thermophila SB210]|uniref:Exportin-7 protein, putative n=1 Tax=Tetrahymena thermophila (strain SB210) TaxID=312017 RepID=I7MLD6_TETTS|nr:exportin-7 protein, putative [Tetrahymena thermophila SB210]EAS01813.2 exportin-7 protein, putative [Tetrahymena thermophila SB210]|eukprot:XP_001022058.2 exportin-7 protein, putative [Tetrahymena thermophila SB210]
MMMNSEISINGSNAQQPNPMQNIVMSIFNTHHYSQIVQTDIDNFNWSCDVILNSQKIQDKQAEEQKIDQFLLDWRNMYKFFEILIQTKQENSIFVACELLQKIISSDNRTFINTKEASSHHLNRGNISNYMDVGSSLANSDERMSSDTVAYLELFGFFMKFLTLNQDKKYQLHTYKSVCHVIAVIFKALWGDNSFDYSTELVEYVVQILINKEDFGILIVDFIIQNISNFSTNMGYIMYRRIILSFQTSGLVPISQQVASKLYQLLEIVAAQPNNPSKIFEKYVGLFLQILSFNFNISYYDFETDQDYQDNQLIQFPEKIVKILVNFDLLKRLFYTTKLLITVNSHVGLNLLRCLSKIVSCRITHSEFEDKEKKKGFILFCCEGITEIIRSIKVLDEDLNLEIIDYCNRMMNNFSLKKLRKIEKQGEEWINIMQQFSLYVINRTQFNVKDEVIPKLMNLWRKIVRLSISIKIPKSITNPINKFTSTLIQTFTERCLQQVSFFEDANFLRFKKFKKAMRNFFENIYYIGNNDLEPSFQIVAHLFEKCAEEYFICLQNRGNIDNAQMQSSNHKICLCLGLVNQLILVSSVGIEKSNSYIQQSVQVFEYMGKMIAIFFKIIESQINYPQAQLPLIQNELTELSILYFMEEYIIKTLGNMDTDDAKTFDTTSTSAKVVIPIQQEENIRFLINNYNIYSQQSIQQNQYFTYVQKYLNVNEFAQLTQMMVSKLEQNVQTTSKNVFEYSLHVINFIFLRLKHNLSRGVFKKMPLILQLSNLIMKESVGRQLSQDSFKSRTKIYELIAFAYMDDPLDNYIEATDGIIRRICFNPQNCTKADMIRFFYDATGLAKHIDLGAIYKVFLKKTYHLYKFIYSDQLLSYGLDMELMVPALKLLLNVIDNKTQRISILTNQNFGYQMFKDFSDFLNKYGKLLMEYFQNVTNKNQNNDKIKLVMIYWRVLNKFLTSKLINFSVFQLYGDSTFIDYLKVNLDLKFLLFEEVFQYPKLTQVFIQNILIISEQFQETVYCFNDERYAINLFLISKRFMEKITQENFKYGNFSTIHDDPLIQNVSQVIQNLCSFCVEEINFKMTEEVERGVKSLITNGYQIFNEYIAFLFNISFSYVNSKIFVKISNALFAFIVFMPNIFEQVRKQYIESQVMNQQDINIIQEPLNSLLKDITLKIDPINQDKFQNNFKLIIKSINQGGNEASQIGGQLEYNY